MPSNSRFVFLIGMPRSGTKLLRDMLNNHVSIFIDPLETQFIPRLYQEFRSQDLSDRNNFHLFFQAFLETVYAFNIERSDRKLLSESDWYNSCSTYSISDVFQSFYELTRDSDKPSAAVIGDKTPRYTGHVSLLQELFPDAKFVHIVRDPRDRALSENKVWGKSLRKSVSDWAKVLTNLKPIIHKNADSFIEIKYEHFVLSPDATLKEITNFLDLPWQEGMSTLRNSSEFYGGAKGALSAQGGSIGRYKKKLNQSDLKRMEQIAYSVLKSYDYPVEYAQKEKVLSLFESKVLSVYGYMNLFYFHIKDKGIIDGWKYFRGISG